MAKKSSTTRPATSTCRITITLIGKNCVTIKVPGQPLPSERVRQGRGKRFYIPKRTANYRKQIVAEAVEIFRKKPPCKSPVGLVCIFYREGNRDCDVDNLQKAIQDALIGVGYLDDKQVVVAVQVKEKVGAGKAFASIRFLEITEVRVDAD